MRVQSCSHDRIGGVRLQSVRGTVAHDQRTRSSDQRRHRTHDCQAQNRSIRGPRPFRNRPGQGQPVSACRSWNRWAWRKIAELPFSIRMLLESVLRNCDGYAVREEDVKNLAGWNAAAPAQVEIPFKPARVLLQDFTGVPAVVDLAAMRAAMQRLGGDPKKINPLIPVDLVIDHSVQVDRFDSRRRAGPERRPGIRAQPRALRVPALGPKGVRQLPRRAAVGRHRAPGEPRVPGQVRLPARRRATARWPCPTRWSAPTATPR